jgi:hypothetical protein
MSVFPLLMQMRKNARACLLYSAAAREMARHMTPAPHGFLQ